MEERLDPEAWRRMVNEVSKAGAPGWERWRARIEASAAPVRAWLIRELAAQPGDTVLELAAGAGDTGFEAAAIVGEGGRLISTDVSPEMLDVARRRGSELGLRNVEYRVMDAEHLELETGSVDGVLCRFGYMLMADPASALAETRRVLRPGGRVALAVWGVPERNPWTAVVARLLVECGHLPAPTPGTPNPFSLASEQRIRALLGGAVLNVVSVEEVPTRFAFHSLEEYLQFVGDAGGPAVLVLPGLSGTEREALEAQLENEFASFAADGGYELPGLALNAATTAGPGRGK